MTLSTSVRDRVSEEEVIAFLRGAPRRPAVPSSFAYVATRHGVAPLLVKRGVFEWLPPADAARLVDEARRQAVLGELRDRQLSEALEALHGAGIEALVMKGSQLAQTCYPESYLRPRADSDVLVRPADRDRSVSALAALGYGLEEGLTNHDVLGQVILDKPGSPAAVIDLHWRIAVPVAAAGLFDFDDLIGRAVPLPALGEHARGLATLDALALACVHQAAHHADHDMLLWAYDIYLLLATLHEKGAHAFVRMAVHRRMTRICLDVIEHAARSFPSPQAEFVLDRLRAAAPDEPPSELMQRRRKIDDLRLDLRALPGWSARAGHVLGHLFPPAAYMRAAYAPGSRAPLAWLYLTRMARGARRWFR